MNEVPERIRSRIVKLLTMIDRGTPGESENAAKCLANIIERYNIDMSTFDANEPVWREYDVMLKHQQLFWQIVWLTVPDYDGRYRHIHNQRRKFKIFLTEEQHIQVTFLFDFYVRDFDKQMKNFVHAYFMKNDLLVPLKESETGRPITQDDIDAVILAMGINKAERPAGQLPQIALPQ